MSPEYRTRITLAKADDGGKIIYVQESAAYVRAAAESGGYVLMNRIVGMQIREFATQATNIVNIEDVSA